MASIFPKFMLEACHHSELPKNTPVFNTSEIEYELLIHLPEDICNFIELFQLDEILPSRQEVTFANSITRECRKPWLDTLSELLNMEVGYHIYKLSFIDIRTNQVIPLYVAYIIQDDNADKSYIYMNREGK